MTARAQERPDILSLDHLVVVAPDLAEGVSHGRARLGLDVPEGGRHRGMCTRNHLLRLGDAVFLEVIAVDPDAAPPERRRWFGLDDTDQIRADWESGWRLRGFVARTPDLDGACAARPDLFGAPATLTRGTLSWRFGLRPGRAWPADGAAPCAMDSGARGTLAPTMSDLGGRLAGLALEHPDPAAVATLHAAIGLADPPTLRTARMPRYRAEILTAARI